MIRTKQGYTIIELVVYSAIMAGIFVLVVSGMTALYSISIHARHSRSVNNASATGMERMIREIRDAESVLVSSSTLGNSHGSLVINSDNASTTGGTYTLSISGGKLQITNSAGSAALTGSDTKVEELIFWHFVSSNSEAVRIKMIIENSGATTTEFRTLYDSAVLRESYVE